MDGVSTGFLPAPGMDAQLALEYADRFGLDHVEIFAEGDPWREGFLADPARVRGALDDRGLDLTAHLPFPMDFGSPVPAVREATVAALDDYLEPLAAMDCERAVLHLDQSATQMANFDHDAAMELLVESAAAAAARGRAHGVEVCVENLPDATVGIDEFERLIAATDVSLTLDTGHAVLDGWTESEVVGLVRDHPERVAHVHLNDTRASGDTWRAGDEHLPFGAGTVDFETILAPVLAGEWAPSLTMEIVTWDAGYVETSADRLHALLGRE